MMVFDGGLCDWFVHYHPQYDAWNPLFTIVIQCVDDVKVKLEAG